MTNRCYRFWGHMVGLTLLAVGTSGCATIIRDRVNREFPPVSIEERRHEAIVESLQQLRSMPPPDVAVFLPGAVVQSAIALELGKSIPDSQVVKNIRAWNTTIALGEQQLMVKTDFSVTHAVENVTVGGRASFGLFPSVSQDASRRNVLSCGSQHPASNSATWICADPVFAVFGGSAPATF